MSRAPNLVFNGKFLTAPMTAVHKVALELIEAFNRQLDRDEALRRAIRGEILAPKGEAMAIDAPHTPVRQGGVFTWQPWEQIDLPRMADGALIVSLCNLGPLAARRALTMVHDAQTFSTPDSYPKNFVRLHRFILPRNGKRHAGTLTVSHFSAGELAKWGVAPREKIKVVYNGVDHILRHPPGSTILEHLGITPGSYSLALANTEVHKNIGVLLEAFASEELKDHTLVLFGSHGRDRFEAAGYEVPPNVIFSGRVENAAVRALMEHANAMLTPSRTEGFGLPPLEAMLLGTPAIVAPCGALPEVCGNSALYAGPDDPQAWVRAIGQLRREGEIERGHRAAHAREQAGQFTWDAVGARLVELVMEQLATQDAGAE